MENNSRKNIIAWIIRIVIFVLFTVSAVAKMFPLWAFEKQLVDLSICDWCMSHYLARLLIGFELALGIAILFPHLLKKLVIPVTIILLVAFCGHLTIQMIQFGAMNGNCGCFGQLIPMTPLEAFVKNIITIGLLIWLYKLLPTQDESWKRILYPVLIFLLSALLMFMAFPFCPCDKKPVQTKEAVIDDALIDINDLNDTLSITDEEIGTNEEEKTVTETNKATQTNISTPSNTNTKETASKTPEQKTPEGPAKKVSKFAPFAIFNGKTVKVDEGKKVLCMFAPGCDHCQNTAKAIGELARKNKIPEVYIYFMDEEAEKIPEFFKIAGVKFPYVVLGIGDFWDLLGSGSTPGVFCQWNGNTIQSYEGIDKNEFDINKFKEFAISK